MRAKGHGLGPDPLNEFQFYMYGDNIREGQKIGMNLQEFAGYRPGFFDKDVQNEGGEEDDYVEIKLDNTDTISRKSKKKLVKKKKKKGKTKT